MLLEKCSISAMQPFSNSNSPFTCYPVLSDPALVVLKQHINRFALATNVIHSCKETLMQDEKSLAGHFQISVGHLQSIVADVLVKINQYAANVISAVRSSCCERAKVLEAQSDELVVSACQVAGFVTGVKSAVMQGRSIDMLDAAIGVKELCKLDMESRVPVKLDILVDAQSVLRRLEDMTVLRLYDIDRSKSTVSGTGLVSCVRSGGAINEVHVTCVNSVGKVAAWVSASDVVLDIRNVDGVAAGRVVGGQVVENGKVIMSYGVDDVDANEVELSVTAGGMVLRGSPWRVVVCSIIKTDATHIKTIPINGTRNQGVAVTLDGQHVVVSNPFSECISVYSTESGDCISKFGSYGAAAGQFKYPNRICATPRGTILVCDCGNRRLQEVTITGEHVRFLGAGLLDDEVVFSLCMRGDIVALGKYGLNTDGRIVILSYSSGALIRKFGAFGSGEGQVKSVYGLSFSPDGRHILVADNAPRLSLFTVGGAYVKTIGANMIGGGANDVLCSGSSVFVADVSNQCVCVFSSESGALV